MSLSRRAVVSVLVVAMSALAFLQHTARAQAPSDAAAEQARARAKAVVENYVNAVAVLANVLQRLRNEGGFVAARAAELCKTVEQTSVQPAGQAVPPELATAAMRLQEQYDDVRSFNLGLTVGETSGGTTPISIVLASELNSPPERAAQALLAVAAGARGEVTRQADLLRSYVSACDEGRLRDQRSCDDARHVLGLLAKVRGEQSLLPSPLGESDKERAEVLDRSPGDVLAEIRSSWDRIEDSFEAGRVCLKRWEDS